jgi:hypothetical protein
MSSSNAIRIVGPDEFDRGTAQRSGSERRAAPALGIASAIWAACSRWHQDPEREFTITANRRQSLTFSPESVKSAGANEVNRSRGPRQVI